MSRKKCYSNKKEVAEVHLYEVAFIVHPENSVCEKNTGVLTIVENDMHGYSPFKISIKDQFGNLVSNTLKTNNLPIGEYTIEVTDKKNCKQKVRETIGCTVNKIPHVITPEDASGTNDRWIIHYYEKYPNVILQYPETLEDTRRPDPDAKKIIITFDDDNEIFSHRCIFYRIPVMLGKNNIDAILQFADSKFVRESFHNNEESAMVAKELKKIEFHTNDNIWSKEHRVLLQDPSHYQFNIKNLFDSELLCVELKKISEYFGLELLIDKYYFAELVKKIKTRLRASICRGSLIFENFLFPC